MVEGSISKPRVLKHIEELTQTNREIENRIHELTGMANSNELSDAEFHLLRQMLSHFHTSMDDMSIEEKRAAIRTVVRKVVWDGVNAHVVLFGVEEDTWEDFADVDAHGLKDESTDAPSKSP